MQKDLIYFEKRMQGYFAVVTICMLTVLLLGLSACFAILFVII